MTVSKLLNKTNVQLLRGDITTQEVDAIVNAANSSLAGGGGVDGAIHRAGGPEIMRECQQIKKLEGGCPAGHAVVTGAGKLKAKYVFHAVGPIWRGGENNEAGVLASAYNTCLNLAEQYECASLAFPSISTGVYGYPVDQAAGIALSVVAEFCRQKVAPVEIRFVLFDDRTFRAYEAALAFQD